MTLASQWNVPGLPRMLGVLRPYAVGLRASFGGVVRVAQRFVILLGCLVLMLCGNVLAQTAPTAPIVLKGAPMGAVKFDHTAHLKVAGKCEVCHHASKPQKPLKVPQEACTDCHTDQTNYASFSCINCHEHTQSQTDSEHSGVRNYVYSSPACYSCHRNV